MFRRLLHSSLPRRYRLASSQYVRQPLPPTLPLQVQEQEQEQEPLWLAPEDHHLAPVARQETARTRVLARVRATPVTPAPTGGSAHLSKLLRYRLPVAMAGPATTVTTGGSVFHHLRPLDLESRHTRPRALVGPISRLLLFRHPIRMAINMSVVTKTTQTGR